MDKVPATLGIVGGGYIGLELGSVWLRLGAKVTVLEMLPAIGAGNGRPKSRAPLDRILRKQGFTLKLGTRGQRNQSRQRQSHCRHRKKATRRRKLVFDRLLVCSGPTPSDHGCGHRKTGCGTGPPKAARILVNERYQTNVEGIYAIGDLVAGPMLAHKASARRHRRR